jgi:hypothetical protein
MACMVSWLVSVSYLIQIEVKKSGGQEEEHKEREVVAKVSNTTCTYIIGESL